MNTEPESQLGFVCYGALKAIRHPRILMQINPFEVVRAELAFRKRKMSIEHFISFAVGVDASKVQQALEDLDVPREVRRYKSREMLFGVARLLRPLMIIETGCGGGYGAAHMLAALELNGRGQLVSVDCADYYDPRYFDLPAGTPCGGLIPHDLRHRWKLLDKGAEVELPALLGSLGTIDMFVHDSLHTRENMEFEYQLAWDHLRPGGVLLSHDIWAPWVEFANRVHRPFAVYQHYGAMVK